MKKNIRTILAIAAMSLLGSCCNTEETFVLEYTPDAIGDNSWTANQVGTTDSDDDKPEITPGEEKNPKDPCFAGKLVSNFDMDYTGTVSVEIDGNQLQPSTEHVTIMATDAAVITFSLKNFFLFDEETTMPVGTVSLKDVVIFENADGSISMLYDKETMILPGDPKITLDGEEYDMPEDSWIGPMLPPIPIKLIGTLKDGVIDINIDIDMQETLGQIIHVNFNTK